MADQIELSAEQKLLIPAFRKEMWDVGTSCELANRPAAEAAIADVYKEIDKPMPRIYWVDSPIAAEALINTLSWIKGGRKKALREEISKHNGTTWWGQYEVYWLAYYIFADRIGHEAGEEYKRRLKIMERISRSCGMWYPFEEAVIICDRPERIVWDDQALSASGFPTRLHCADGPAILYRDGWSIYYHHGLRVPRRFIEKRADITPEMIEAEGNQEWRRALLEIYGFDKWIEARGAKVIDEDEVLNLPRRLFRTELPGGGVAHVVEVNNGSLEPDGSRRKFHIGVPDTCMTCEQAVAWTYGLTVDAYKTVAKEGVRT